MASHMILVAGVSVMFLSYAFPDSAVVMARDMALDGSGSAPRFPYPSVTTVGMINQRGPKSDRDAQGTEKVVWQSQYGMADCVDGNMGRIHRKCPDTARNVPGGWKGR